MMDLANVFTLIGLAFVVVGAAWVLYNTLAKKIDDVIADMDKKIDRIYLRMDERIEKVNKEFIRIEEDVNRSYVRFDMHNLTIRHLEEKTDDKFAGTIKIFELKMDQLTAAINKLVVSEEKRSGAK